jgi:hypothetical protein
MTFLSDVGETVVAFDLGVMEDVHAGRQQAVVFPESQAPLRSNCCCPEDCSFALS